jgi:hypothetical protein
MFHEKVGNVTHTASCPIAESEQGFSPEIVRLLYQGLEDGALVLIKDAWSQDLFGRDFYATSRVPFEQAMFINEPLAKTAEYRLGSCSMAYTVASLF